ncbi:hypothetical protein BHE74_00000504 [Ensete ventricosum]|uniref:Uncharacterized protein n=1 Tax=Ensete ventricosum TaxID=4639 RepID=A0A444EU03_ENSVE|nr:hypothetical protein GW17_00022438 [Ensete ventricosum]RWW90385.1 hypothetical protein BHE74_00000504 [Ensete ventricosum]RZR70759.1 hypothetical protein BHM03_00001287 [Ensete ventricosum]
MVRARRRVRTTVLGWEVPRSLFVKSQSHPRAFYLLLGDAAQRNRLQGTFADGVRGRVARGLPQGLYSSMPNSLLRREETRALALEPVLYYPYSRFTARPDSTDTRRTASSVTADSRTATPDSYLSPASAYNADSIERHTYPVVVHSRAPLVVSIFSSGGESLVTDQSNFYYEYSYKAVFDFRIFCLRSKVARAHGLSEALVASSFDRSIKY